MENETIFLTGNICRQLEVSFLFIMIILSYVIILGTKGCIEEKFSEMPHNIFVSARVRYAHVNITLKPL